MVHDEFGIGRFNGFETIQVEGTAHEVVVLEYRDSASLNVHVGSVHKVHKYSGREGSEAKISRLGSGEWARKKARTKKRLKDITDGLIKLYARRQIQEARASGVPYRLVQLGSFYRDIDTLEDLSILLTTPNNTSTWKLANEMGLSERLLHMSQTPEAV